MSGVLLTPRNSPNRLSFNIGLVIRAVFGDALLNPATSEVTRQAVLIIEDGRVTKAGKRDGTHVPRDGETIDAAGLTLLPGLIDCHVHLTSLGEGLDFARELTTPPTFELMRARPPTVDKVDCQS